MAFLDGTDPSRRRDRLAEYGDPADPEMRTFLKSISPLTHAAKLKIPLFIVQGAKDTRVPPDQAEAMVKAVRANGTPVWYVVYDAGPRGVHAGDQRFQSVRLGALCAEVPAELIFDLHFDLRPS